jgi:hypothetical protein
MAHNKLIFGAAIPFYVDMTSYLDFPTPTVMHIVTAQLQSIRD